MRTQRLAVPLACALVGAVVGALVGWLAAGGREAPTAGEVAGDAHAAEIAALRERVRDLESRPRPVLEPGPRTADASGKRPTGGAGERNEAAATTEPGDGTRASKKIDAQAEIERLTAELLEARRKAAGELGAVDPSTIVVLPAGAFVPAAPVDRSLDLASTRNLLERGTDEERARALARLEAADDATWEPLVRDTLNATPPPANAGGLMRRLAELKDPGHAWSAKQATGPPDTPLHGDHATAWAPKQQQMGEVTLDLAYAQAVRVDGVSIHETLNPGAVARIFAWAPEGRWELLWEGTGSRSDVAVWFAPPVRATSYVTSKLRIILDTDRVPGWNEIDAVELIGDGLRQWASEATASSEYSGTQ